ncbi:MAG: DUF4910 domain-containing protein [bacterium]
MTRICSHLLFLLILPSFIASAQFNRNLLDSKTRDLFHEAFSGELAKAHVYEITRHHRIQGSRGYRAAAQYVLGQLRKLGFSEKDACIESYKSDGKIAYQTWQSPSGWDIEWGELRMLEPYEERIVGYPEIAMSVMTYSNPGDVTAELVWVGSGLNDEDYTGKDVTGKIVLATGYGGEVHRLAVLKYGAKAVVCYLDDERAKDKPDMLAYTGMWPRTDELDRVTFGFNLTHRQGEKLKNLLQSGKKVVLRGQVKGIGLEPYAMDIVVAHLRGSEKSDEEVLLTAHLDHPKESANDNASGSAALLDIARSLNTLIKEKRLPQPKRSFRFLWVPEFNGSIAYIDGHPEIAGPERGGKCLAGINMDMVGENEELTHSAMVITRTPPSLPSVINVVVENMAQMVDGMEIRTPRGSQSIFNYRITEYSGGSDHVVFNDLKVPSVMIVHDPDYTHHTSEDTPDKVDPVELERAEMIATGTLWYLANLTHPQAIELSYLACAECAQRIGEATRSALQLITTASSRERVMRIDEARIKLEQMNKWEQATLTSILSYNDHESVSYTIGMLKNILDIQSESYLRQLMSNVGLPAGIQRSVRLALDRRVPIRLTRGPISDELFVKSFTEAELKERAKLYTLDEDIKYEVVNWIDGKRSIAELEVVLMAEFGRDRITGFEFFLEDLVKAAVLKWN